MSTISAWVFVQQMHAKVGKLHYNAIYSDHHWITFPNELVSNILETALRSSEQRPIGKNALKSVVSRQFRLEITGTRSKCSLV